MWEQPKAKAGVRAIGIPAFLVEMLQAQLDERIAQGLDETYRSTLESHQGGRPGGLGESSQRGIASLL